MIDSKWLNKWSAFVNDADEDEPPGKISTKGLLDKDGKPLQGLHVPIDYRGVTPLIYQIFINLYGKDDSPELCRYAIDIYKLQIPVEQLVKIKMRSMVS